MRTYLEALRKRPRLQPEMIVRHSVPKYPRVKTNPDGSLCHVRSRHVQSNRFWLILITYIPRDSFRVRVYLRPDLTVPILDKDGLYTVTGAEWAALSALESAIMRFNRGDEKEEESCTTSSR